MTSFPQDSSVGPVPGRGSDALDAPLDPGRIEGHPELPAADHPSAAGTPARLKGAGQALKLPGGNTNPPEPPGIKPAVPGAPGRESAAEGAPEGSPPRGPGAQAPGEVPTGTRQPRPEFPPSPAPGARPGVPVAGSSAAGGTRPGTRSSTSPPAVLRQWKLEFPAGLQLLSMNGREHFMARHRKAQVLKNAAIVMTRKAKVPRLERIQLAVFYDPPIRRKRDHDNLMATYKHLADGITQAGVVPSDDIAHVLPPHCEVTDVIVPRGRLRIVITEILAGGAA